MTTSGTLEAETPKHEIDTVDEPLDEDSVVGTSQFTVDLKKLLREQISDIDKPVLLYGEKGAGKGFIAARIHQYSRRSAGNFAIFDCSLCPPQEHLGEIFGAAENDGLPLRGLIHQTRGGTLVLKEIAELNPRAQVELDRYLKSTDARQGPYGLFPANTRIIATSSEPIRLQLSLKVFREDLFYLLNCIEIAIAPLRERKTDIQPLIEYFSNDFVMVYRRVKKQFTEEALRHLESYYYPNNVQELKNIMERLYCMTNRSIIDVCDLPAEIQNQNAVFVDNEFSLANVENNHIRKVLRIVNGNRREAAKILGISERSLYYRLKNIG